MKRLLFLSYVMLCPSLLASKTDVIILSQKVGTQIDQHENRFYRIFPSDTDLTDAQIIRISEEKYMVSIVKFIDGKRKEIELYIGKDEFLSLKKHVDSQPIFTEEAKIAMYEGMDFLRVEKVLNEIPKPQYVILDHSNNKKLKGTLIKVVDKTIFVQTANMIETVYLEDLDRLSYRPEIRVFSSLKFYSYAATGLFGYLMADIYNNQRPTTYNEYGVARKDVDAYRKIFGTIIGLIFSSEVSDAISTLLTPKETIILSEAEYEKENY